MLLTHVIGSHGLISKGVGAIVEGSWSLNVLVNEAEEGLLNVAILE